MTFWPFVLKSTHNRVLKTNQELRTQNTRLEHDLREARKNDNRNPQGRYTKG